MSSFSVTALVGFGILASIFFLVYFKNIHFGYGMVLEWDKKDGSVWVSSVLLKSPAGIARVKRKTKVISVNGLAMNFSNIADFKYWVQSSKPRLGHKQEEDWSFSDGLHVTLRPALILQKIPVYWTPNSPVVDEILFHPDLKRITMYCRKTGVVYQQVKVSKFALVRALSDNGG